MPQAVSRKQYRMMMAIVHGKAKDGPRGRPPKSVAAKYTDPGKDAPEDKHKDTGGTWGEKHHAKAKEKSKQARIERKKSKKDLKKSFEEFYKSKAKGRAAATLVMDGMNRVLLATHTSGSLAFPGGMLESNESYEDGALREMNEECGAIGRLSGEIYRGSINGNECVVYLAEIASGKLKNTDNGFETMKDWKWYEIDQIPWSKLRDCCRKPMEQFISQKFGKSLQGMLSLETLEKSAELEKSSHIDIPHKTALKLVGNGVFRTLKSAVDGMSDEDFKDVHIDSHIVSIRKHLDGKFSGRVNDGHKQVYQFTNKSLHELAGALMSVFEWYLPEDEDHLSFLDDADLDDDAMQGGINQLMDNYKRHNIGNIYHEMETIREQLRNGQAVDLQQVEHRIMTLFDKLEDATHNLTGKHNQLAQAVGKDMDELESKLRELQNKIESTSKKPEVVEAYSANPANHNSVHDEYYSYLPRPKIEISPNGKITISFSKDWQDLEKENFLKDMRARVITKVGN